uniref:Uncharacterized protein n=1 Tax=Romanomermis culicivorax TaxID=13658 RepID=A0A915KX29_ROMCU
MCVTDSYMLKNLKPSKSNRAKLRDYYTSQYGALQCRMAQYAVFELLNQFFLNDRRSCASARELSKIWM